MIIRKTTWAACGAALLATGALATTGLAGATTGAHRVEAESLYLERSAGEVRTSRSASGGASLLIWSNATASKRIHVATPGVLRVRARAQNCHGSPHMKVSVDGTPVLSTSVRSTKWRTYRATAATSAGWHRISVSFVNDRLTAECDRNLEVDRLSFGHSGGQVTATAPAPTSPAPSTTSASSTRPSPTSAPPSTGTPTPAPSPTGRPLFDSALASRGLGAYASVHNAHRVSVVNDPVLGSARKVLKLTVHEADNSLTGNPRAQLETAKQFSPPATTSTSGSP